MLKIFKKINEIIDSKTEEYTLKNISEFSRFTNRPLEGEIIKIDSIRIRKDFKKPNSRKLATRKIYYEKHNYFRSQIVVNKNNYLVDGYTTYLIAKEKGFNYITVVRSEWFLNEEAENHKTN